MQRKGDGDTTPGYQIISNKAWERRTAVAIGVRNLLGDLDRAQMYAADYVHAIESERTYKSFINND